MKIAVTIQGTELTSKLDPRFGRAKSFMLIDSETNEFEICDNTQNTNAASGAGIQTAQNVANLGADAVITGNVGPNACKTLKAAEIKIFLANDMTVGKALGLFKKNELKEITEPNVDGHWA